MAKTNFTKVEASLDEGLQKMKVNQLYEITESEKNPRRASLKEQEQKQLLINTLQHDVKIIEKHDHEMYGKIGIEKKELKELIANSKNLSPKDWELVKQIQQKVAVYKEEILKNFPQPSDDQLIEKERRKHINKRFNVNERWLPLK